MCASCPCLGAWPPASLMRIFLSKRLLQLIPTAFLASFFIYALLLALPGDPATMMLQDIATHDEIVALRHHMGLDRPVPIQYAIWLWNVAHGDLGVSYMNRMPVGRLLLYKLPVTFELALSATLVSMLISVPMAAVGALNRNAKRARAFILGYYSLSLAVPIFWLGLLLVLLFGVFLKWLPPSGFAPVSAGPAQWIRHMLLPSIALGVAMSAFGGRFLQSSLESTLTQDYIRTARSKGLRPKSVLVRHVLRNSLIPFVTALALQIGTLMGGAVMTEAIFGLPGVGLLLWQATLNRDYAVIQGTILLIVFVFIFANLLADVVYGLLDPRIRYG
jgi:peptide/nickel transport system permease protein